MKIEFIKKSHSKSSIAYEVWSAEVEKGDYSGKLGDTTELKITQVLGLPASKAVKNGKGKSMTVTPEQLKALTGYEVKQEKFVRYNRIFRETYPGPVTVCAEKILNTAKEQMLMSLDRQDIENQIEKFYRDNVHDLRFAKDLMMYSPNSFKRDVIAKIKMLRSYQESQHSRIDKKRDIKVKSKKTESIDSDNDGIPDNKEVKKAFNELKKLVDMKKDTLSTIEKKVKEFLKTDGAHIKKLHVADMKKLVDSKIKNELTPLEDQWLSLIIQKEI